MRTGFVDYSTICTRQMAMNSFKENTNYQYLYDKTINSLKENSSNLRNDAFLFFDKCTDLNNANNHYKRCLSLIEKTNEIDSNIGSYLENKFLNIIPYIESLNDLKDCLDNYLLNEEFKDNILKSIKEYKVCDRIISNDIKLSKRFGFNKYVSENTNRPLEDYTNYFCSMIETYTIPPYAKMNIIFEEMNYLLQKYGVKYDRSSLVEQVTDYFLFRESNINKKDYDLYKSILKDNITLNESDISNVLYFIEEKTSEDSNKESALFESLLDATNDVQKAINAFKADEAKSEGKLKNLINRIFTREPSDILDEVPSILSIVRNTIVFGTFLVPPVGIIVLIVNKFLEYNLEKKQLERLIKYFNNELEKVEEKMDKENDTDKYNSLSKYQDALSKAITKFEQERDDMYSDDDVKSMFVDESSDVMSLNEFKIFKFHNLIRATIEIDKFLRRKSHALMDNISKKAHKVFDTKKIKKWFTEGYDNQNILETLTSNNNFDICIASYLIEDKDMNEMNEAFSLLCNYINSSIITEGNCYYYKRSNIIEVRYKEDTYVNLSESDKELSSNLLSEDDEFYINSYLEAVDCIEKLDKLNSSLVSLSSLNLNHDNLSKLITINSIVPIIKQEDLKESVDNLLSKSTDYIANTNLRNALMESNNYTNDISIMISGIKTANYIIESSKEQDDALANKINKAWDTFRLGAEDAKTKTKNLSAKVREISKNLDSTVAHFYNSAKQFVTNDRREAIIKGSIIPSFSKTIIMGIAIAGTGIIDPVVPVISLLGVIAISKKTTEKERALILDEIDIELKVVEKEIQMADSENDTRKMRTLMTYQKKLMREKARIKYNIKVGQDLPGGDE